jgi:hypothetical protein
LIGWINYREEHGSVWYITGISNWQAKGLSNWVNSPLLWVTGVPGKRSKVPKSLACLYSSLYKLWYFSDTQMVYFLERAPATASYYCKSPKSMLSMTILERTVTRGIGKLAGPTR